jgi:cystathionine gamma-synthase
MDHAKLTRATIAVAAGRPARAPGAAVNMPISTSSTFHSGGDVGYARDGSDSTRALEEAVGGLDGGEAISFGSGTAAVAAVLDTLPVGSVVVAPNSMYWGTLDLLHAAASRGRFTVRAVEIADTDAVVAAIPGATLVWVETPTNPMIAVADVPVICAAARAAGALSCVDATFATPLLQRPLEQGADLVMHSATKFLAGHSDLLLGVLVAADPRLAATLRLTRHRTGAAPGTLESFLALRGIRTLDVRLRRQLANTADLARRLVAHATVTTVHYPGLPTDPHHERATRLMDGYGAVLSFELADAAAADEMIAALELITDATSLGGVETLIERRAKYAGEQMMNTPTGLLRLAVGIEDVEDLWADLSQALNTDAHAEMR